MTNANKSSPRARARAGRLLRAIDSYTLWAFNTQQPLAYSSQRPTT